MPDFVENMMHAVGEKDHIKAIIAQLKKFRLGEIHIERFSYWDEPYKSNIQIKGFDQEYLALKVHYQSWNLPLGEYNRLNAELAGLNAFLFRTSNNFLGTFAEGNFSFYDAAIDPHGILDVFNECYTVGLPKDARNNGKPLAVTRSELGLRFKANPAPTGGL